MNTHNPCPDRSTPILWAFGILIVGCLATVAYLVFLGCACGFEMWMR